MAERDAKPDSEGPAGRVSESPLPADLARALGWLRGHLSEAIDLERLASVAGVRPRTLEAHFKTFLGTTPLGWVRRMRTRPCAQRTAACPRRCNRNGRSTGKWLHPTRSFRRPLPGGLRRGTFDDLAAESPPMAGRCRRGQRRGSTSHLAGHAERVCDCSARMQRGARCPRKHSSDDSELWPAGRACRMVLGTACGARLQRHWPDRPAAWQPATPWP